MKEEKKIKLSELFNNKKNNYKGNTIHKNKKYVKCTLKPQKLKTKNKNLSNKKYVSSILTSGKIPTLVNSTDKIHRQLVQKNTNPLINRLFNPTTNIVDELQSLQNISYGTPPGPACNWRKCSNKGGCGSECVCHPAGKYGWRCIPKCCIRADGYPPCRFIYKYDVMCTLPCSGWPGLCQENYWNPYHTYQGPYEWPKGQPNIQAI